MHEISSIYLDHVCSLNALNVIVYFRIVIAWDLHAAADVKDLCLAG